MKAKILAFFFLTFASITTYAQQVVNVDIKAGMAYNGITKSNDFDMKPGFRLGVGVDFLINEYWSIRSSFLAVQKDVKKKGTKEYPDISEVSEYSTGSIAIDNEMEALYIQVPVLATYTLEINYLLSASFGAGPYVAYGIAGDTKTYIKATASSLDPSATGEFNRYWNKQPVEHKYKTFGKEGLKKFDYGLALAAELNVGKHFFVGFGAEYGLANIKKLPKSEGESLVGINKKTASPHRYGFDMHVGFRL
ncbi:porin family protein [Bacteroides sp. 224]|uniref:porin family protein n=1 Tax=Bacteroides sp. 224 TaxID=2302936 RepID=UPI0013CFC20B|nr:porin family protein [Bacteroides sp. 224]NDV64741.1 PorT family protein [Bacteroides sp. 224]